MHLKDGTPARPGDIIKSDTGTTGLVVGGYANADACNLHVLQFGDAARSYGSGRTIASAIFGDHGEILERVAVNLVVTTSVQSAQCERLAHVDIGNG